MFLQPRFALRFPNKYLKLIKPRVLLREVEIYTDGRRQLYLESYSLLLSLNNNILHLI